MTDTAPSPSLRKKCVHCAGCRNDIYNHADQNPTGTAQCWSLADAKLVRMKLVHINDVPPWTHRPMRMLNCYSPRGYVKIPPERTC